MSKGKGKRTLLGIQGIVGHRTAPDWGFIYEVSTIKNPNYDIGDSVDLPNGKGFVYCKSGGACYTGLGNILYNNGAHPTDGVGIPYANNVMANAAIGATSVVIKNGTLEAQLENGLRGGTILFKQLTGSADSALQCRGIIGNTAGAKSANITIYLDAPLTGALTTSSYSYCMPSPYSDVRYNDNNSIAAYASHVGVAATYVSAANMYHWEQYKGRVFGLSKQGQTGKTAHERELVWRYQGSVQVRGTTDTFGLRQQVAGYVVDRGSAGVGGTEIMLTGNI